MNWLRKFPVFANEDPGWGRGGGHNGQGGEGSGGNSQPQPPRNNNNQRDDGPPDLDELWRNFNDKLNRFFGRGQGGNGGGSGGSEPNFKGAGIGAGAILGAVGLLWLSSGFFIIQEGQVGVVLQFGKYSSTTGPGFQWRMPYPLQAHEVVNISQIRTIEVGYRNNVKTKVLRESLMLTDDENIIDIQFAVQYKLKDAAAYLFNNRNPEETVLQAAETAIREVVGRSKMDYVLYEGREQVGLDVSATIQQILDRYNVGISVSSVSLQNAQPPEQVQASFDDAVKAAQDLERLKSEGEAYANDVVPKAKGGAARLLEEANGYKQRVVSQAEGDAARFKSVLTEYTKAPAVTRDRLYIETMQQVLSNVTKVMTDSKQNSQLLYLPLDKLINQVGADSSVKGVAPQTTQAAAGGAQPEPAVTPTEPQRPRPQDNRNDNLRNREKGAR